MARTASGSAARPSMVSTIKAYSLPLLLFFGALFFQLVLIPKSFPPSYYDVLGIKRYSSIEEVNEAYNELSSKWNSEVDVPITIDLLKIQYAYELLTNPLWKRNYDLFGLDEQSHVLEKANQQYAGQSFSKLDLPLLDSSIPDTGDHSLNVITSEDFKAMFQDTKPWLIQLYSSASKRSAQFSDVWKRIAALLDGVASTASVELGDLQLVAYLAEKKPSGHPFFRNGIPSLVAFPPGCKNADCLIRYNGELSVDAITDWFATTILSLPRIFYYTKESLGPNFLAKASPHKVKVIFFSKSGERASPFIRQSAKNYWDHASFAFVLWREEESSVWFNAFEVESAPAIVILKDPGVKPLVHHGAVNNSQFLNIMEHNKLQELPQLRSTTSMDLGCDARGYSRAGYDTTTWYCAILAGRHGPELNKMRETMRRVQQVLSDETESSTVDGDESVTTSLVAFKAKRLTFAWLDGEAQKRYCFFYLNSETSYETCGPRRDMTDVAQLFIVRYKRNSTEENRKPETKRNSIWDALQEQELDSAAQLVARYNGSAESPEIIKWISQIVKDGDSRDLPHYVNDLLRTKTPDLVPEDADPIWIKSLQSIATPSAVKQRFHSIMIRISDHIGDPRIGPILLLGALMSFGTIWLRRSEPTLQSNPPSQPNNGDASRLRKRDRIRTVSNNEPRPSSVTDSEPKDAYQMPFTDSDSE